MKTILTILASLILAHAANAQLIPATPAERALSEIDRAASGSRYYLELTATSLSRLHSTIFISDDATLKAVLEKLGPVKSTELLQLYFSSADAINQLLAASGSTVRAPATATREWTWEALATNPETYKVTVTPLPVPVEPTPEPTPEPEQ